MKRRAFCTFAATLGWARSAIAQFSSGPVTIVVPFAPGGSGDITARLIGQYWLERYGLAVVVETKPGANGIIGMQSVKNDPADGTTLVLATTSTLAANLSLFRSLPYDPEKDFTLVAVTGGGAGSFMLVRQQAPYGSLAEFVAFARANPRELHYGYFNASAHVSAAQFAIPAGIELTPVPYRQIGTAINDLAKADSYGIRRYDCRRRADDTEPGAGDRPHRAPPLAPLRRRPHHRRNLSRLRGVRLSRHGGARRDA